MDLIAPNLRNPSIEVKIFLLLRFDWIFSPAVFQTSLKAEAKKLEDASTYLSLPSTKIELEEKGHSATGKSMQNLGSCTISKDSFQISTLVCSTKLTQNGESPGLLELLLLPAALGSVCRLCCLLHPHSVFAGLDCVGECVNHPSFPRFCSGAVDVSEKTRIPSYCYYFPHS